MPRESENWVIIGTGNGLLPVWHQATTCTNIDLYQKKPEEQNSVKLDLLSKWKIFLKENVFENVACKMTAILLRPQCVHNEVIMKYISK